MPKDQAKKDRIKLDTDQLDNDLDFLIQLSVNGVLYYRHGAWDEPVEGDRRDTGKGLGRNGDEVYTNGKWTKKIDVGSVGTDMITLREGLNDVKVKEDERTYNLLRKLKTMPGIQVGSSFSPLALTSSSIEEVNLYYPDTTTVQKFIGGTIGDVPVTMPCYFLLDWNSSDAIVKSFNFKTSAESRIRLRLYYTEETNLQKAIKSIVDDSLVYESLPDTECKNPEDKNYGGVLIPKGDSETDVRNEMYLTYGKKYVLEFDNCVPNFFLGNGSIPFFSINWWVERSDRVVLLTELLNRMEERLKQDIVLNNGMWFLNRGQDINGKPGEARNIGGIYGDEMCLGDVADQTVLQSVNTPMMRIGASERVNIASEKWVTDNTMRKIMDMNKLNPNETAILYQTEPPTYLQTHDGEPPTFPEYNIEGYLRQFSCKFMPHNVGEEVPTSFILTGERGAILSMRLDFTNSESAYAIVEIEAFAPNGSRVPFEIRTDATGEAEEGTTYATPYIPSTDINTESHKEWSINFDVNGGVEEQVGRLILIDPNGGRWTVEHPKVHYLDNMTHLYAGTDQGDTSTELTRLWNIHMIYTENADGSGKSTTVNEQLIGIKSATIVTNIPMRKAGIDTYIQDAMAIHKFKELSKDFHTFFRPYDSGVYRCFDMTDNLPEGYTPGDNDFYCFLFAVSTAYKTIEALDIRSGRRFTKSMLGSKWADWFEWGINQGGQVPIMVYTSTNGHVGNPMAIPFSSMTGDANADDVFWVTCGSRGQAVQVYTTGELVSHAYSAAFYVDKQNNNVTYCLEEQGMDTKSVTVYKFVKTPVVPPGNASPYITLTEVLDELTNATQQGDRLNIIVETKCLELMRNLSITITTPGRWETTPVLFDGKAKYYFKFPWQPVGTWKEGEEVTYQLEWQDQNGRTFKGFETITKPIMI